jgi:hypothetical protein
MNGGVAALRLSQYSGLYVGGGFTKAGSISTNKIARLYESKWYDLDGGVTGINATVNVIGDEGEYIGGNFSSAGGLSVRNIANWNGILWSIPTEFPKGFDGPVYAIENPGHELFVGGDFKKLGNTICNNIIGSFQQLGSGLTGPCFALGGKFRYFALPGDFDNHLYVGGSFEQAGLKPSQNFAIWGEPGGGSVKDKNFFTQSIAVSPNPATTSSSIKFTLPERMNISISIIDPLGRQVLSLGSGWREASSQEVRFDVNNLPNGIYYCCLQAEGKSNTTSFLVLR